MSLNNLNDNNQQLTSTKRAYFDGKERVDNRETVVDESMTLNGLLINYKDDQINECVHDAIKRMSRVRYKCMDIHKDYLAFGTSSGGIYLFALGVYNHSDCSLKAMIPCDAGSVEVIRFLPNTTNASQDLLIAIGTSRGSLVIFRLTQLASGLEPFCVEIFKAESFTPNCSIKSIDFDQSYQIDPEYNLEGVYVCDTSNRIYRLDFTSMIKSLKRPNSKQLLSPLLSVNDSTVNQISIYRNTILISTDENSRLYYEENGQNFTIGSIRRKDGCYGSCFYNSIYQGQNMSNVGVSTNSLSADSNEPFMCFVARPNFRLWHVNHERKVMFTHKFEPRLASRYGRAVTMTNKICTNLVGQDDPSELLEKMSAVNATGKPMTDHFERLMPIYTKTLGNLLLSYSRREIFVINPIEADLIVWIREQEDMEIIQVSCYENELFVWSSNRSNGEYQIKRLVLFAPTQMVLELHRLQRHLSLIAFVQLFAQLFKQLMALPLSNRNNLISTEGGLLRNVLLSSWSATAEVREDPAKNLLDLTIFEHIIDEIMDESRQLKDSFYNLANSRLYLTTSKENMERLYSEPYTSLVTLQVSIASLHTEHVIHFDQETIDRHRKANLSQTLLTLQESKQRLTMSNDQNLNETVDDLGKDFRNLRNQSQQLETTTLARAMSQNCVLLNGTTGPLIDMNKLEASLRKRRGNRVVADDARVMVERKIPQRKLVSNDRISPQSSPLQQNILTAYDQEVPVNDEDSRDSARTITNDNFNGQRHPCLFEIHTEEDTMTELINTKSITTNVQENSTKFPDNSNTIQSQFANLKSFEDSFRCPKCRWPRERLHCHSLNSSKLIQLRWIESNLMQEFETNLDEIERRAFEHGLWNLYLECKLQRDNLESYVTFCMMLDDVRLIDLDGLVRRTEIRDSQLCHQILDIMETKLELRNKLNTDENSTSSICCLNCEMVYQPDKTFKKSSINGGQMLEELEMVSIEDGFSFNLINFFDQILAKRFTDLQYVIQILIDHPKLINISKIPFNFYLKVISTATLIGKQPAPNMRGRILSKRYKT